MSLTFPTKLTIFQNQLAVIKGYLPDRNAGFLSELFILAKSHAHGYFQLHRTADRVLRALFPPTTYGIYLDALAVMFGVDNGAGGFGRKQAAGSTGALANNVTSTGNGTVNTGDELTDTGGLRYQVTGGPYTFVGVETKAVSVAAIDDGAATNLEIGAVLSFVSPPTNIEEDTVLIKDLDGGRDRELDPALRKRLLSRTQNPSISGNDLQWQRVIQSITEATVRGYVWPKRINGSPGTVDYAALQEGESGAARLLSAALILAVDAKVVEGLPVRQMRQSRQLTVAVETGVMLISFALDTTAGADLETDWDSLLADAKVASEISGDPSITADKDLDAVLPIIAAGVDAQGRSYRVFLRGEERKIVTFTPPGDKRKLFIDAAFSFTPSVSDHIMAGGGIQQAAWDAVQLYADGLGPERGPDASTTIPEWDDTIRVQRINEAINGVNIAVLETTVVDIFGGGAVDKAPTALTAGTVNLLTWKLEGSRLGEVK